MIGHSILIYIYTRILYILIYTSRSIQISLCFKNAKITSHIRKCVHTRRTKNFRLFYHNHLIMWPWLCYNTRKIWAFLVWVYVWISPYVMLLSPFCIHLTIQKKPSLKTYVLIVFAVNTSNSVALTSASASSIPTQFHLHPNSAPLLQIQPNWDVSRT